MATFNFPVYSKDDLYYYKHLTPTKCIMVGLGSIRNVDLTPLFEEQEIINTNAWNDVLNLNSTIITKQQFDEFRKETINQLIKY
tara:strand:+ start:338 stop:589 length:252 start_codon:yes stop_codon:yes gene_type:complete